MVVGDDSDADVDVDSLFGSDASHDELVSDVRAGQPPFDEIPVASRSVVDIPGMYMFSDLLARELHDWVLQQVSACGYFHLDDNVKSEEANEAGQEKAYRRSPRNQAMLFARSLASSPSAIRAPRRIGDPSSPEEAPGDCAGLPAWAVELILKLRTVLELQPEEDLPRRVKEMLFPDDQVRSRQLILNLYNGAEGLASHVDLVNRFADGILLCSFGPHGTGTVMDFSHKLHPSQHLFLPSGSVLVLSGEARYGWEHGITARGYDVVRTAEDPQRTEVLRRSIRLSITIRTMLPGADIVGE
ncbi:hypothetical protein PHSY_002136 [Pseudozyma hubeiensis SY62]|uniref:Fe2OG dioxygenase domain-containing protein n=1 Tax=Pseudozyma hubeiensis (strain SY62) TaxID=1305764 RepID=R9P050_PSEHS|nr:hypothetical protein PHSY_002136 [Pseudozyma hubeiensis SY62]GAC94563.1 hypothetical protein PHSY_002136 [Pseudozyma hubeiensis SY62]